MKEILSQAREKMKGFCRVCSICDGRACAGETPGMGGIGTGTSFRNNVSALAQVKIEMRLIHNVTAPKTDIDFLGKALAFPVLTCPIAGVAVNMTSAMSEDAYAHAIVTGSKEAGVIGSTGDGVLDIVHTAAFESIKNAGNWGIPFIKPWEGAELETKLNAAFASKFDIIGMDIDAAGLLALRASGRPVSPKTFEELRTITSKVHAGGAKFIVKGIMTVEDALLAQAAGADALLVSNHGGRVLDYTFGTAEVLPAIAKALKGKTTVIVDGGVRNGVDVFKMIALGADMVGIGRPASIAAIGGGVEGVTKYLKQVQSQLVHTMLMTGCASVADIRKNKPVIL